MSIKLVGTKYNEETFNVDYNYEYKFTLDSELKTHQLTFGFIDDLRELLKERFDEELKTYLTLNQ